MYAIGNKVFFIVKICLTPQKTCCIRAVAIPGRYLLFFFHDLWYRMLLNTLLSSDPEKMADQDYSRI